MHCDSLRPARAHVMKSAENSLFSEQLAQYCRPIVVGKVDICIDIAQPDIAGFQIVDQKQFVVVNTPGIGVCR